MLLIHGHYKYFDPHSTGIAYRRVYRRQILTSKVHPRAVGYGCNTTGDTITNQTQIT